jgi:dienelactone hydrolase
MRAISRNPVSRPIANPPTAWQMPEARCATILEVVQVRMRAMRAAALHRDPPAMKAASRAYGVAFVRMLLVVLLATALFAPERSQAAPLDTLGLLWLPDGASRPRPTGVVIALYDSTGIDSRGWQYGDQLTAAGIAVLQVELLENSADGFGATVASEAATAARARLTMVINVLAGDPRFADMSVGLLAFGDVGQVAVRAAADPAHGDRIAGLVLLYPGCAAVAAAATVEHTRPRSPVLLVHGDVDPANLPADCSSLAAQLARFVPVRHRQYAGAGYAWDRAPYGRYEAVKLPWPGRPGLFVDVSYWPEAAELSATQVAAFFATRFMAHRQ